MLVAAAEEDRPLEPSRQSLFAPVVVAARFVSEAAEVAAAVLLLLESAAQDRCATAAAAVDELRLHAIHSQAACNYSQSFSAASQQHRASAEEVGLVRQSSPGDALVVAEAVHYQQFRAQVAAEVLSRGRER